MGSCGTRAPQELREKRHKFWHNDVKPFMQALASVSQSMAPQSLALSDALTA